MAMIAIILEVQFEKEIKRKEDIEQLRDMVTGLGDELQLVGGKWGAQSFVCPENEKEQEIIYLMGQEEERKQSIPH